MAKREKLYKPTEEEFLRILNREFELSDIEKKRIKDFSFGDEDTDILNWSVTALSTRQLLMIDYRNGHIEFKDMLDVMRNLSLGLSVSQRVFFLGAVAEFGLKTHQKHKAPKRGTKNFHPNPPWFKRTVVDVFDQIKSSHPKTPNFPGKKAEADSIYKRTAEFLAPLKMLMPEPRTIEAWLGEPQNQDVQEYRLMKKTRRPE